MQYSYGRATRRKQLLRTPATPGRAFLRTLLAIALSAAFLTEPAGAATFYAVVLATPRFAMGSTTLQSGLFISVDNAHTWRQLGPRNVKGYSMDAVDSSRGRILFMAAGNGIHRSTDFGASWRIVTDWRMTEVMDVMVDQQDPRWIYAATASGFWRSSDGGDHWENPPGDLHNAYAYRLQTYGTQRELIVAGEKNFYRSTDHGTSWKPAGQFDQPRGLLRVPGCDSTCNLPEPACQVYATGDGLMVGADNWPLGRAFRLANCPRMNVYAMALAGTFSAYVAGDSGIWKCNVCEQHCEPASLNIPNRIIHALVMAGDTVVAGTYGDGLFRLTGRIWQPSGLEGAVVWTLRRKEW